MTENVLLQSESWRRMHAIRTCPPLSVLQQGGSRVAHHLSCCHLCREALKQQHNYEELGALLASLRPSSSSLQQVEAGDIRRIKPQGHALDWFDCQGIYRNPPLVLVLDNPDEMGFVRVAQIFDEPDLCAVGDILLNEASEKYAEAWNTYGLPVSGLSKRVFETVPPEKVQEVLTAEKLKFPEFNLKSPLHYFRLNEIDTGSFFSLSLNEEALSAWESMQDEKKVSRQINFADALKDVAYQLKETSARWDDYIQDLPRAAAANARGQDELADDNLRLPVMVRVRDSNQLQAPMTVEGNINIYQLDPGCVCEANIQNPDGWHLLAASAECEGQLADKVDLEASRPGMCSIIATFSKDVENPAYLHFVVFVEKGKE